MQRFIVLTLLASAACAPTPPAAPVDDAGTAADAGQLADTGIAADIGVAADVRALDGAVDANPADVPPGDMPVDRATAPDAPPLDTPVADAPPADRGETWADAAGDGGSDGATDATHADAGGDVSHCDPGTPCHAFWCGCGSCNPANIVCVSDARGCPLGCASSCPEEATAVCACTGGVCGAPSFPPRDAGSADAGGLPVGSLCGADAMCASGLLCCYPCGIPGCMNRCGLPDPRTGRCPLLP